MIVKNLTPKQIVQNFLPYMNWTTSKADDVWVLELPDNDRFNIHSFQGIGMKLSQLVMRSATGTFIVFNIKEKKINGKKVRFAQVVIGDEK